MLARHVLSPATEPMSAPPWAAPASVPSALPDNWPLDCAQLLRQHSLQCLPGTVTILPTCLPCGPPQGRGWPESSLCPQTLHTHSHIVSCMTVMLNRARALPCKPCHLCSDLLRLQKWHVRCMGRTEGLQVCDDRQNAATARLTSTHTGA